MVFPTNIRHVIRLRGPWQCEPLARTVLRADGSVEEVVGEIPPPGTLRMPSDWGPVCGSGFRGRVRFTRSFGRPTGLEATDQVQLVFAEIDGTADVSLGEHRLGGVEMGAGEASFEVRHLLAPRNRLVVVVELPAEQPGAPRLPRGPRTGLPGGIVGEVTLRIVQAS